MYANAIHMCDKNIRTPTSYTEKRAPFTTLWHFDHLLMVVTPRFKPTEPSISVWHGGMDRRILRWKNGNRQSGALLTGGVFHPSVVLVVSIHFQSLRLIFFPCKAVLVNLSNFSALEPFFARYGGSSNVAMG